jgi:P4 family phage/plasmid primase-like protien
MEWDGRHWDTDDVAEPRILETVRLFMDTAARDYRAKATATETRTQELIKVFAARDADEEHSEKGKVNVKTLLNSELVTDEERKTYKSMLDELMHNTQQANIWLNLLSAGKVSAVTKLCRGMDEVITRAKEFDTHLDLLNCLNGVLDLSTGQLAAHDPSFMMTHLADTLYDPSITSPVWDKILSAVHPECQDWYQIRMGQAATGHTPDNDELLVQEGGGENGKSAMMHVLMRALGSYAGLISHRVLIAQPGQHPTELMDLRGLRLALLEETPEEGRLDPQQVKNTVGTPRITARRMRCDPVTFVASHTLVINTNHHPQVDSTDWGTWRRLKSMPWPYRFLKPGQAAATEWDRPGDSTLKRRLEREPDAATAALSWLVGGAMAWYAHGQVSPEDPQAVKDSTDQWRQKSDVGYRFAEERLVAAPDHFITADMMRIELLLAFLASEGKQPWSSQTINIRLKASMQAAKIVVGVTPEKPATVRQGDVESRPPFRPTQWDRGERSAPQWIPGEGGSVHPAVARRPLQDRGRDEGRRESSESGLRISTCLWRNADDRKDRRVDHGLSHERQGSDRPYDGNDGGPCSPRSHAKRG